jgi:hypothetical protein
MAWNFRDISGHIQLRTLDAREIFLGDFILYDNTLDHK